MDTKKGSTLVYGFKQDMGKEQLERTIHEGKIGAYLNYVPVQKNDLFFIEAGTVHAYWCWMFDCGNSGEQ